MGIWETVGALAAPIAGNLINWNSQQQTNEANRDIAERQMQWQGEMSNTAHQREVKDLQAAGLNPILSAGGNGASTPSGAGATMQAPRVELPDMLSYGISLRQAEQAQQKIEIDKANSAATISKMLDEQDLIKMEKIIRQFDIKSSKIKGDAVDTFNSFLEAVKKGGRQVPKLFEKDEKQEFKDRMKYDYDFKKKQRELNKKVGPYSLPNRLP